MNIKKNWLKFLIISLLFTVFLGRFEYKMPKRKFADFHVNYYTGQKMLKGDNVYDADAYRKDKMAIFKYPPIVASITALFALTSERTAATIWFIFNFLLILVFMFFSGKIIFKDELDNRQRNWVYFWSLFLTSRFYMQNFDEGQVNFLMMTTLFLGMYAASRNKNFLGGVLIGFSILVKYMSAIVIPYLILRKKFKLVYSILISLVMFSFLPALFWGWGRNLFLQSQYLPYLNKTSLDIYSLSDFANQSLISMIIRFFSNYGSYGINFLNLGDFYLGFLTGSSAALLYVFCVFPVMNKWQRTEFLDNVDLGMLFICAALFNPNAWMHAFIFLTFGYMVTIFYLFKIESLDKTVISLVTLSFVFHSFCGSFLARFWVKNLFEIYPFVTLGALFLFVALIKIKFFPKIIKDYGL